MKNVYGLSTATFGQFQVAADETPTRCTRSLRRQQPANGPTAACTTTGLYTYMSKRHLELRVTP